MEVVSKQRNEINYYNIKLRKGLDKEEGIGAQLIKIRKIKTLSQLEKSISKIEGEGPFFKGKPYVRGKVIYISTHGLPGEFALAEIVETGLPKPKKYNL